MIITVTLNPAIDKTYTTTRLMQGQVNRMNTVKNIAGGKGINVTKILRQYGHEVTALGFLGGYSGNFIESYVKEIGATCSFTQVKEETRSSINIIAEDGYVTELLEPGPVITQEELTFFLNDFNTYIGDSDYIVLSGSASRGVTTDIYATLIDIAKKQGKKVLLDSSGEYLAEGVKAKPYMIKPNVKELEFLVGQRVSGIESVAEAASALCRSGIAHVFVSMGKKGLVYADDKSVLCAKVPNLKTLNTVGCGDSVVASFCMSLLQEEEKEMILKKAAAISAANATTLDSAVIPMEFAEELVKQIVIKKI